MAQRMVHYVGGPLDGLAGLMEGNRHPFMISLDTDTDGYYVMEYQVAGQRIGVGNLTLTTDDVIARWHQRSSSEDFMTGDIVIIKATGERVTVLAPTTYLNEDGTAEEGWTIKAGSSLTFVTPDRIRIATADELGENDTPA
jgi:hypothetical protein